MAELARRQHPPDCSCTRCVGFTPGNDVAVRHGAYVSADRLGPEVAERVDYFRELLVSCGLYREAFEPLLADLGLVDVRIERASEALRRADEIAPTALAAYVGEPGVAFGRLRKDMRGWLRHKRSLLDDLGLSPQSMTKAGARVAQTESMVLALQRAQEREA